MKFFYSIVEALKYSSDHSFIVIHRTVFFPIYVNYGGHKDWVIFTPGACSRAKPMPVFQRSSYSSSLTANVISIFDPGLFLNNKLTNSWFCGTPSRYYAEYVSLIIKQLLDNKGADYKDVVLFGTSAGGLPALKIAQCLPGATVWVGNIQVDASIHPAFNKMLPVLFSKFDKEKCIRDFHERFDARKMDGSYNVHYFQNTSDVVHYKKHYKAYKDWVANNSTEARVRFYEYDDPVSGHGSVGRHKELDIIHRLLLKQPLSLDWVQRA
ncbi:hypothetical protein R6258_18205 [Halomonas sp. HP20-15]|uniref:hypothetical protein n=1 Tax=Halomonas sp. HP20-15 TaxID=3085901 RepID=UPI002981EFD1|nr:hypothetical protein [Halomonas sp. HP20-15]MDW5378854.1 hypothetical protein [Halomonas sp. HP20-15]